MSSKYKPIILILILAVTVPVIASCIGGSAESERVTVTLAAPQSPHIQDFDTNLYKLWLEGQTGLNIEMIWLPAADAETIARQQLQSGENLPDAYIGFGTSDLFASSNIQIYGERGVIIPLGDLIESYGVYTKALWEELPEFGIRQNMTSADGNIYFMPGFSASIITRYRQIMWVNKGWLDELDLQTPATTDEFADMLRAFRDSGSDRIPMAGTGDHYSKQPYDFLFNAFIYNDIRNSRMLLEDGVVSFAPVREQWRDALIYMRGLYDEGLYSPLSFMQDNQQMNQMANDPMDILGAFVSPGITLTVLQNSPEILSRYIGIGPLTGPYGVKLTTVFTPTARVGGVITSASQHPEEVFKLFDLMLSEEASLMGRYGEQGVDWEFAMDGDISIYGTPAAIRVINQIWNTPQNKHLAQITPYISRPKYSGGVTWDGSMTDGEYMNAQAAMLHMDHEPKEYIGDLIYPPDEETRIAPVKAAVEAHISQTVIEFITGERDVHNDAEWRAYLSEYAELGLYELLAAVQTAYERTR